MKILQTKRINAFNDSIRYDVTVKPYAGPAGLSSFGVFRMLNALTLRGDVLF